jgi:tetratricopeptide (TPR) repeat protein
LVIAFCLFSATKGWAAPSPEAEREARRAFQAAEADFKAGRFTDALASYQSGYAQAPLPGFLINIAQCYRRLGDLPKAKATYQKFVMVAPDSPHVPEVRTLIAELDKLIADLAEEKGHGGGAATASSSAPAAVSPLAAAPAGSAEASPATAPRTQALTLPPSPAQPEPAHLLTPAAPAGATETSAAPAKTRWWLWGLVGAAVVVAGGTAAAFALAPSTTTVHEGSLGALRR